MSTLHPAEAAPLGPAELDARFRRPLMSFFLNRLADRTEAEDLTQQTFLRLLAAPREEVSNPAAFVFRVASNLLVDRGRKRGRDGPPARSLDDEALAHLAPADVLTPERILLGREDLAVALRALDELGQTTRDAFVLFRFEKMPQREIAARLGLSPGAVEKQIMRATLHLLRAHEGR